MPRCLWTLSVLHRSRIWIPLSHAPTSDSHLDPMEEVGGGWEGRRALRLLVGWLIITILEVGWGNDSVGPQGRMIMAGPLGSGVSIILLDGGEEAKRWPRSPRERLKGKTWAVTEKCKALFHVSVSKLFFVVGVIRIAWAWGFRSDCGAVSRYLTSKFQRQTCSFSVRCICNLNVLADRRKKYKAFFAQGLYMWVTVGLQGNLSRWMANTHVPIAEIPIHGDNESRQAWAIFRFVVWQRPLVGVKIIRTAGGEVGGSGVRGGSVGGGGSGMDGWLKTSQIVHFFPL